MKKKTGRPRHIESVDHLKDLWEAYKKEVKSKPYQLKDWVGGMGKCVIREREKPLIIEGFYCFVRDLGVITTLKDYFSNRGNSFEEFVPLCSHIREEIRVDQISGGMANIYNTSITQRLNNLSERTETLIVEQPLFPDNNKE